MLGKRHLIPCAVLLTASIAIGLRAADAVAGWYQFCDASCIGPSCPDSCGGSLCGPSGANCETDEPGIQDCCGAGGIRCTERSSCSGKCAGVSPACTCTTTSGLSGC